MKIVKFKDGQYGIRRLTLIGYQYLGRDTKENYWWTGINCLSSFVMTKEEVIARWEKYPIVKRYDFGKPVDWKVLP